MFLKSEYILNLKLFPSRYYSGDLKKDTVFLLSKLEKETLLDNQYVVEGNTKTFHGILQESSFNITLSSKYFYKLCFFKGYIKDKHIYIKIQIKKGYKWLFGFLLLYPLIGLLVSFILRGADTSKELIFHSLMAPVVFKISLELLFAFISKRGVKHLNRILEINMLKRNI